MKITGPGDINKPSAASKKKRVDASGSAAFGELLSNKMESAPETHEPASVQGPASVGGLLALQEYAGDEENRRQGIRRGEDLLSSLERIRDGLLIGLVPEHHIRQLQRELVERKRTVFDPRLRSIINDIEVRAAVELAKLERLSR